VKYLLDTNVFLWSNGAPEKLNRRARTVLSSGSTEVYLSAASSWEIAIKFALRALRLPSPPSQFIPDALRMLSIRSLEISHFHSIAAGALPPHHRDPFDRMLIAQACSEEMVLLTADEVFAKYEVETMFCAK
jgi:PIN domain nuclease of toxin-antitoxin system